MPTDRYRKAADKIERSTREQFGELYSAEKKMVRAAVTPDLAVCGPSSDRNDSSNDPKLSHTWGPGRDVRAQVIRWMCIDREMKSLVDPLGIRLLGAEITDELDLSFVDIPFPIGLFRCRLADPVILDSAQIPALDLSGSWTGPISATSITIKRNASFSQGFRADGEVSLVDAEIGSDLDFSNSSITNKRGVAINADGIKVGGFLHLRDGFRAEGVVRMVGAKVGGDLICASGESINPGGSAVILQRAAIKGTLVFVNFNTVGVVDFQNAATSVFEDDQKYGRGSLMIEGLVYDRLVPKDSSLRLRWLGLDTSDTTQPYRQLAKVLDNSGDADGAQQVLKAMEAKIAAKTDHPLVRLLKGSIGYGYNPEYAVWYLLLVTFLGWLLCWRYQRMGLIVPTEKDISDRELPSHYPSFNPLIYSLENTFPLVKLGQAAKWQPKPAAPRARFIRIFLWIQILLGWLLATLFVAGLSGIIHH